MTKAWYHASREKFAREHSDDIVGKLFSNAVGFQIAPEQKDEWLSSVKILKQTFGEGVRMLHSALKTPECKDVSHVVLEYDFKRRGLRMDCVLLGSGVIFVVEFKRTKLTATDREQVMNYAVNLLEFHAETRRLCEEKGFKIVPMLALTGGTVRRTPVDVSFGAHGWRHIADCPIEADRKTVLDALLIGLRNRTGVCEIDPDSWLNSPFSPSSSIIDATLSLYGNHDVSAIKGHAAAQEQIDKSVTEIGGIISSALSDERYHIVFLSGAPGAGKTLVGLDLAMRGEKAGETVFVTGNAPLVEVLNAALCRSYKRNGRIPSGYRKEGANIVIDASSYKIVKAHSFLGDRTKAHRQNDGRVIVFDEAQRTYEKGKLVNGRPLKSHEADLILRAQRKTFPKGGAVIVALIGHNQAINRGEMGLSVWLESAKRRGWTFSISDKTLALAGKAVLKKWGKAPCRRKITHGHLDQSMRYYRNEKIEQWASDVLDNKSHKKASKTAGYLERNGDVVYITRDLAKAREWVRSQSGDVYRAGLIASGQARRLAAEGLFVDHKPDIAAWMLEANRDIRSSNALETVQNQYQIQGLELDYAVVCWDVDLRRESGAWCAYKMRKTNWGRDSLLDVAKNGYRVLLTRARRGMVIFVPRGDLRRIDFTRVPEYYDGIWDHLCKCGAKELPEC